MTAIYILALIGAVTVSVLMIKAVRQFVRDLRSKPTPWLMTPWAY